MLLRSRIAIIAALFVAAQAQAPAATLTFASFSYVGAAKATYDNSTGVLTAIDVPIKFNYVASGITGTPATGFGSQDAKLTFSAARLANAGAFAGQGFQSMALTAFSITRNTPLGGLDNLLSGSVSDSVLVGTLGGSAVGKLGSVGAGATVFYASDFITFPPPTDADFSWALQSVTPSLAISGVNFNSFHASVAGTFGYNANPTVIPEASSLAMLSMGLVPLGLIIKRRMKVTR